MTDLNRFRTYLTIAVGIFFSIAMVLYLLYFHRADVISPIVVYRLYFLSAMAFNWFNVWDCNNYLAYKPHILAYKNNAYCLALFYTMGTLYYFGLITNDIYAGATLGCLVFIRSLLFLRKYYQYKYIAR